MAATLDDNNSIYVIDANLNERNVKKFICTDKIFLTLNPTYIPSNDPTNDPTTDPTNDPTNDPTTDPTNDPTNDPTTDPTNDPTTDPTNDPTNDPTTDPTIDPTNDPTTDPTIDPTNLPTNPSTNPTANPTISPAILKDSSDEDDLSSVAIVLPIIFGSVFAFIILLILYRIIKNYTKKQYLNIEETEDDIYKNS